MLLRLAARSVFAKRSRTFFLVLSLALSSCVLVVGASLVSSIRSNIEGGMRRGLAGDLQVFHADNPPLELTAEVPVGFVPIGDPEAAIALILQDDEVVAVAPRANASGILLGEGHTAPVVLIGIDPGQEAGTLDWLLPEGRGALDDAGRIVLGAAMAERLGLRGDAEDSVALLIPTADGLFDGDVLQVTGVYDPPGLPLIDEFVAVVRVDHLQVLLGEEGYPGSLIVRLRDGADVAETRQRLRAALQAGGLPLEVRTWDEMAGDLLGIARVGSYILGSGFVFVLLVVSLGVGNMLLILMLEKTREIGLMRALGTPRARVVGGLIAEAALVSALASAAGALAGGLICTVAGRVGIPAASRAMSYALGGDWFFPEVHAAHLLLGFLVVALLGPVAALRPALRASATSPAEVMRNPV